MSVILEAKSLRCTFGSKEAVKAFDLELRQGDLAGLIGPDGAGKTTAFRMLAGLQTAHGGELRRKVAPEAVAYVPQVFALPPDLTVEENMRLQAGLYGLKDAGPRIRELLSRVDLDRFRNRLAGALSGGMKQKLALCAALLPAPRLLLLDEPTTGVDPVSRREFWSLLHQVHDGGSISGSGATGRDRPGGDLIDGGVAILFSSPYMDEAEYAFHIHFMSEGRILGSGTVESFRSGLPGQVFRVVSSRRREVQTALAAMNPLDLFGEGEQIRVRFPEQDAASLLARLRAIPGVERAEPSEPTLEDAFLHALAEEDAHA